MIIHNLLLVAGTGTKSGKTSMVCRVIKEFPDLDITAIKITPHFHETTAGLELISEGNGFAIYEETNRDSFKDTSRMLFSGAYKVYLAKVWDDQLPDVFNKMMEKTVPGRPVICESPALRNFIEPGVFIIMVTNTVDKYKDINHLQVLPHVMIKLEELAGMESLPVRFENGRWIYKEAGRLKTED